MKNLAELAFGNSIYAGDGEGGQFEQYAEEVQFKKSWNFTGHQLNVIIRRKKFTNLGAPYPLFWLHFSLEYIFTYYLIS